MGRQARAVNRVWNYCDEIHDAARRHNKRWPSGFDLIDLTSGSSKLLGLHSDAVQAVCKQFASSRDACGGCGARHDRDINSAINLLVSGRNVDLR
jgi:hypothetical protein